MHQYTADIANRLARVGYQAHLVTTSRYPRDRYISDVTVLTPVDARNSGFAPDALRFGGVGRTIRAIQDTRPDVVHITGPHLWNLPVLRALRQAGIPVVHTLHDLDPHLGSAYGPLLYGWNRAVLGLADQILVHGVRYRNRLVERGLPASKVSCTPLLHLFLGHTWLGQGDSLTADVRYDPSILFFGRLERYKGVSHLLTAWAMMDRHEDQDARLILAGPGKLDRLWAGALPPGVEVRDRLIDDAEAVELFRRCGVLVLPYHGATQSALIPAAYYFHKPVVAAPSGALDEYVEHGETGWVVEPEHPASLARCLSLVLSDLGRLAEMGLAGRSWYDTRRDAEEQSLWKMYRRLAAKPG
jgi:glycosyltransferase involved in cell wall biosynthesis